MVIEKTPSCRGRRRDETIDARVLGITSRHLAERGFAAISFSAIAEEANTTRQALYRRWPTKERLVGDAIRVAGNRDAICLSDDPRADLEHELALWIEADSDEGFAMAGAMLARETPEDARDCYREHVLAPRRQRMTDILSHAQALRRIDAAADVAGAVGVAIGAAYVAHLSGAIGTDWPARTAALVWRAVGGTELSASDLPS
ncbi:MAG TPA: helix-turn-helix domain-containing protein [Candidatus Limnocylindria bacterium]|nr:helix-turn-helix domain-containing protein [Candidatus Limnocylindria bacterium]